MRILTDLGKKMSFYDVSFFIYLDCRVFEAFKLPLPKYVSAALIFLPPIIPVASAAYHNFLGFGGTMPVCAVLTRRSIAVTTGEFVPHIVMK